MNKKIFHNIAVLMGGVSSEREVSLRSGAAVARGLRQKGYAVTEVDLRGRELDMPAGTDAVFIALHGEFGEDGQAQELLERMGLPYTGASPSASRLAFDKEQTKLVLVKHKIATPAFEVLRADMPRQLPLPVVVKPVREGSSYGVHRVVRESDWTAAMGEALTYNGTVLVEEYIAGRELTVGVVAGEVLPVVEIHAPDNNFDYRAKYTKGVTTYTTPAALDENETRQCQSLALATYQALGVNGMGRIDLRMAPDGRFYVLELNTIPGFTETSLLPKAAAAMGWPFADLCERILQEANLPPAGNV